MNKLILITLFFVLSCKKEDSPTGIATFYQNTNKHNPTFYFNGKPYGLIKRIGNIPVCGINEKDLVITLSVQTGKHLIQLKDTLGVVVSKYVNVYEGCQLIQVR